jgi:hypothetical protein
VRQLRQFCIEKRETRFQRLAMPVILASLEFPHHSRTLKQQAVAFPLQRKLLRRPRNSLLTMALFRHGDLFFYRFTFPTTCHAFMITVTGALRSKEE